MAGISYDVYSSRGDWVVAYLRNGVPCAAISVDGDAGTTLSQDIRWFDEEPPVYVYRMALENFGQFIRNRDKIGRFREEGGTLVEALRNDWLDTPEYRRYCGISGDTA